MSSRMSSRISSQLIKQALKNANETRSILFGENVLEQTGELFKQEFPGKKAIVVADENTFAAAGRPVVESLRQAGVEIVENYIFPGSPTLYASYENVEILREYVRPLEETLICSIAAGTLNDLAKLASGELGREYMNVCTAASVDGFSAFGASISKDGFKITHNCPAPAALVVDLGVVANAPNRLTATGYGDLIEKIPAGADWILADQLGIEDIPEKVWELVQGPLHTALADPVGLREHSLEAIEKLAEGNIMSGLAMQAMRSSRPASGAGHQFSHVWEMEGHGLNWEPPLSHGFKVGVGTVASCAIWADLLENVDVDSLDPGKIVDRAVSNAEIKTRAHMMLYPRIYEEAWRHATSKNLTGDALAERIELIKTKWVSIVERVKPQLLDPVEVADMLDAVEAPSHPQAIGITEDRFRETHYKAQMIRPRYTVLDVLTDLGELGNTVDRLFSKSGYWGQRGFW